MAIKSGANISNLFSETNTNRLYFWNNYRNFAIETDRRYFSMTITTDQTFSITSMSKVQEVKMDIRDWTQYSQRIATVMSKRMLELGLTQQMLAEKMECTQQYISNLLKGKKNLSLETICKIENALGVEIINGLNENER